MKVKIRTSIVYWFVWVGLIICFSKLGYDFRPTQKCDIYNYWIYLEGYKEVTLYEGIKRQLFPLGYVLNIWFWLVAQANDKFLLSSSSCLVVYGIYLYIFTDFCRKKEIKWLGYLLGIVFILGNLSFFQIASSMRNFVAVALCCMAVYIESRNKWLGVILWLIAFSIHPSAILILVVYFLIKFRCISLRKIIQFFLLVLPLVVGGVTALFLHEETSIMNIIAKYSSYFVFSQNSFSNTPYYFVMRIFMYSVLLVGYLITKRERVNNKKIWMLFKLFFVIEILTFIIPFNVYSRFYQGAIIFMAIMIVEKMKRSGMSNERRVCQVFMMCTGLMGFVLHTYLFVHVL